ncbi:MAG: hypothetical protein ACI4M6_02110 [Christensenellaceae bacterium]
MYFSDCFQVDKQKIEDYGAIDINLICDLPLFIDPMLIFNSAKPEYINLHNQIIQYFHFLAEKSRFGFSEGELTTYFNFSEIKNNWFGYSKKGNVGNGNGKKFSRFFAANLKFCLQTHGISNGTHFEKTILLHKGSGRDKVSDLTTRLILDYLATYTQKFSLNNIDKRFLDTFYLDAKFNYKTETFESCEYILPFIINNKGKREFVILTPRDILRKDEPTLNRADLAKNYNRVRNIIDNDAIRSQLENYICKAVAEYERSCQLNNKKATDSGISEIEKYAFMEALDKIPELYDYYIKLKESEKDIITDSSFNETTEQLEKFYVNSEELVKIFKDKCSESFEGLSAREEAKRRLIWFKHIIEHCDGYKVLYYKGLPISTENDLQRLFRFVWYGSIYDVNFETNNGRGQSDVKVSFGAHTKNITEFKLASNPNLSHIFKQVKIYEQANQCDDSLYAIFYFSEAERLKVTKMISDAKKEALVDDSIFLIDCRSDNKASASIA